MDYMVVYNTQSMDKIYTKYELRTHILGTYINYIKCTK